ncbi:hypothetical protein DFS34DRAFT_637888 [Phlyctochytrium arcticum]|nr:hypothetical protein DFS34DRAFT_637888 [Phlyctochytrium arcticum]
MPNSGTRWTSAKALVARASLYALSLPFVDADSLDVLMKSLSPISEIRMSMSFSKRPRVNQAVCSLRMLRVRVTADVGVILR